VATSVSRGIIEDQRGCRLFPFRPAHQLGQSPVEHDHFAETAQDDVVALEIAVDDAAAVRVSDRVADGDKGIQAHRPLERVGLARPPLLVIGAGRLAERAALDEAHRVERLPVSLAADQLVDWDDPRMLQLAGDLSLLEKAPPEFGMAGLLWPKLL